MKSRGKKIEIGEKFNRLTVIEDLGIFSRGKTGRDRKFICSCCCGKICEVWQARLKDNKKQSCGCLLEERKYKSREIINLKNGKLVILEDLGIIDNRHLVLCKCACGKTKKMRLESLISGKVKSCGCAVVDANKLAALPENEAACNEKYKSYEYNAKKRNLLFEIDKNLFKKITSELCFYCGAPPNNICKNKHGYGDFIYNGIDRKNGGNYTIDNIVSCCFSCNQAKSDKTLQEFKAWVIKVYNNFIINKEN